MMRAESAEQLAAAARLAAVCLSVHVADAPLSPFASPRKQPLLSALVDLLLFWEVSVYYFTPFPPGIQIPIM